MSPPAMSEVLTSLLRSPRGLLAVTAAVGSFVAFVYLFLIKGSAKKSTGSRRSSSKSSPSKSTPAKSNKSVVGSPLKQIASTSSARKSADKQKRQQANTSNRQSSAQKSSSSKEKRANDESMSKKQPQATKGQALKQVTTQQKQHSQQHSPTKTKDDGEWITVGSKKKPNKKKVEESQKSRAPQTRSSTLRGANSNRN